MSSSRSNRSSSGNAPEVDKETAYELIQKEHRVGFLEAEYRRLTMDPSSYAEPWGSHGELVGQVEDHEPEPDCSCGTTFESIDEAQDHLETVAHVLEGNLDPGFAPLRFDSQEDSELKTFEFADGVTLDLLTRTAKAFATENGIYQHAVATSLQGNAVHEFAGAAPYKIDNSTPPDPTADEIYGPTTPFEKRLATGILAEVEDWFDREQGRHRDELGLWYSGQNAYLVAPEESYGGSSISGVTIGGCAIP